MGSLALIVKRARAGIGLLVTILALTAATTAIIAGTLGYSQAAATTAARQALTDAVPTEAGIRVQTRLAEDPDAQDTAARRIIDEAFAPAPIRVQRTLVSEPRSVQDQDDRLVAVASTALLSDDPDFAGRVDVVEGSWPSGPGEGGTVPGALHAAAAERLGVGVADTLSVGEVTVTVEALWRPVDPQAAFWFGDPLVAGGGSDGEAGPLVVHPDAIASLGGTPFARWTVQPDAESIEPDDLPLLASAASRLQDDMSTPEVEVRGVTVEGDLAPTTATAASNLATARALNVVPVAVLLLVSVIAIVQIARLLAQSRSGEVELLIARGADRGQVWRWNLVESVVLVALATTLGIAGGVGVVRLVPAGDQQGGEVTRAGLLTGLAVLVALAVIALLQVRALAARSATDRSGRTRQVAAIGTLVLTLGAATLAWWQLRRYGSPLVTDTDGSTDTDLLAGAAPALLLAAVAVVAMALLGPLGRLLEALTRPTRRLAGHLASSQVSRRLVVYAVPVVLTVLAVGATTLSSLYAATSAGLRNDLSALGQGAEVSAQVDQQVGSTPPATLPVGVDTGGLAGLRASAPVWRTDTRIGSTDTQLTVIPADRMTEVMLVPDSLDLAGLPQTLRPSDFAGWGAVEVPEGSTELTLDLSVQTSIPAETVESLEEALTFTDADLERENPDLSEDELARLSGRIQANLDEQLVAWGTTWGMPAVAWVEDSLTGRIHRVALDPTEVAFDLERDGDEITAGPTSTTGTAALTLPRSGAQRIVGLEVEVPQFGGSYGMTYRIEGVTADVAPGRNLLVDAPELRWGGGPDLETTQDRRQGTLQLTFQSSGMLGGASDPALGGSGLLALPLLPAEPDAQDVLLPAESPPVPVAITPALAQANNLSVGSDLTMTAWGVPFRAQVAAVVAAVPGTLQPEAVIADSLTLATQLLPQAQAIPAADQLWLASDDPQLTVEQLRSVEGVVEVTGPGTVAITDPASAVRLVFWVASAGAVLLAVTGIGAVAAALLGGRRPEVAVLRALGMTPGAQARSRVAELLGVVGVSVLIGLGAGWLVGAMVVPELARSTTLAGEVSLPALLRLELPLWLGLLGILTASMAVLVAVLAHRVRRQALDHEYREEIR